MIRKILPWISVGCCLVFAGCAAIAVGAGVGAGAFTYINGELKRSYNAGYADTLEVCTGLLRDFEMPIIEQSADGVQSLIATRRKDGTPVTLKVKIIDLDVTEVSVRTGEVGYWNRDLSLQFQEFIARRLAS